MDSFTANLKLQAAVHGDGIMAALTQKFGSAPIDVERITFDASPDGVFLGVSVDGERIFERPDLDVLYGAAAEMVAYGASAVWMDTTGLFHPVKPEDLSAPLPDEFALEHRCRDFDADCTDVPGTTPDGHQRSHLSCWLYDPTVGWCPFLRDSREQR